MTSYFGNQASYDSLQTAFEDLLFDLYERGVNTDAVLDSTSIGSHFGMSRRPTRELLAKSFVLTNVTSRLVQRPGHEVSLSFAIASFLWFMSADDGSEMICFYNNRGASFLQNGRFCCAFGSRVLMSSVGNQLELVVQRLTTDPMSRRAAIAVFLPKDLSESPRDTPCLFGLHFFIRNQQLICITTMRSQSAALILPYDIFILTMLQEYVALRLGIKAGTYCHNSNSLHFYLDEQPLVEQIIANGRMAAPTAMPLMPSSFAEELPRLMQAESIMRNTIRDSPTSSINDVANTMSEYSRGLYACLVRAVRILSEAPVHPNDPPLPSWYLV